MFNSKYEPRISASIRSAVMKTTVFIWIYYNNFQENSFCHRESSPVIIYARGGIDMKLSISHDNILKHVIKNSKIVILYYAVLKFIVHYHFELFHLQRSETRTNYEKFPSYRNISEYSRLNRNRGSSRKQLLIKIVNFWAFTNYFM